MSKTPATYTPDEDVVDALIARVPQLVASPRNCYAGAVTAYGDGVPDKAVFVTADSGLAQRPFKGVNGESSAPVTAIFERSPTVGIMIRSEKSGVATAYRDGQALARECFEALSYNQPEGYCECVALNSEPSYSGRAEDGHHEWLITVQLTVDVVVTL